MYEFVPKNYWTYCYFHQRTSILSQIWQQHVILFGDKVLWPKQFNGESICSALLHIHRVVGTCSVLIILLCTCCGCIDALSLHSSRMWWAHEDHVPSLLSSWIDTLTAPIGHNCVLFGVAFFWETDQNCNPTAMNYNYKQNNLFIKEVWCH